VVAETTPAFAWSGPFNEPTVRAPEKVFAPVKMLVVYVFGIVVEPLMNEFARVSV
jgi:hypothetical protein